MNFFRRRKLLKRVNYLDLTPLRLHDHEVRADGLVTILLTRFKNIYLKRMFQPRRKSDYIRIRLDATGSSIWLMIDGEKNVRTICDKMKTDHPDKMQPAEETESRVTKFLSLLYHQRYITFREIT